VCFYAKGPVVDAQIEKLNSLLGIMPKVFPAAENTNNEILACLSLANIERINTGSTSLYETALRMTAHDNVVLILDRINKHPNIAHIAHFHEDRSEFSDAYMKILTHGFAGLALCALYRKSQAQFISYASAAGQWGGAEVVAMLRIVAVLHNEIPFACILTSNVIMPLVYPNSNLYASECEIFGPNELAAKLSNRVVPPMPSGTVMRTRVVDGELIPRVCGVCGKKGLKLCTGCKKVYYCSKECQAEAWKEHKLVCNK
jgi:MYND finger